MKTTISFFILFFASSVFAQDMSAVNVVIYSTSSESTPVNKYAEICKRNAESLTPNQNPCNHLTQNIQYNILSDSEMSFICDSANNDTQANEKAQMLQDARSCLKKDIHLPSEYIVQRKKDEKFMILIIFLIVLVPFGAIVVVSLIKE